MKELFLNRNSLFFYLCFLIPNGFLGLTKMESRQTVCVLAPHPDDETIGAGGLILSHIQKGDRVIVVFLTLGEQFPKAAGITFKMNPLLLKPHHFREFGKIRQQEGKRACQVLGIPKENQIYLKYPTHSLEPLYFKFSHSGFVDRKSGVGEALQEWGHHGRRTRFSGASLLNDLMTLFRNERPRVLVLPHPEDTHKDHQFTTFFAQQALKKLSPNLQPEIILGYFIHYKNARFFPKPYGYLPENLSPLPPIKTEIPWIRLPLSDEFFQKKKKALTLYSSQIDLKDNFLLSFLKRDELFGQLK